MSTFFLWSILSYATGNPFVAAIIVLGLMYFGGQHFFFAPSPLRWWQRRERAGQLERLLANNPHDRRARYELADNYVERAAYAKAAEVLRPNLEKEQDDDTLYLMGVAAYGSGDARTGEQLLSAVAERNPGFRQGAAFLALGTWRTPKEAIAPLQRYCQLCSGTIEGRTRLAAAYRALGDGDSASKAAADAWEHYRTAPRFQRRRERLWAYRANRVRSALIAGVVLCGMAAAAWFVLFAPRDRDFHGDLWEGFARCGKVAVPELQIGAFTGGMLTHGNLRLGEEDFCFVGVRSVQPLVIVAVHHEDINDPGDAHLMLMQFEKKPDGYDVIVEDHAPIQLRTR